MNTPNYLPARDYAALKAATKMLINAIGGPKMASRITRTDEPRLSRYGSLHEPVFIPLDAIADLQAATDDMSVTRELAEMQGYLLVKQPSGKCLGSIMQAAASLTQNSGDVVSSLILAVEDGLIDGSEANAILTGIKQVLTNLVELEIAIKASRDRHAEGGAK